MTCYMNKVFSTSPLRCSHKRTPRKLKKVIKKLEADLRWHIKHSPNGIIRLTKVGNTDQYDVAWDFERSMQKIVDISEELGLPE